jgi:hypothetical protein
MKIGTTNRTKSPTTVDIYPKMATADIDVKAIDSLIYNKGVQINLYPILPCPNIAGIDDPQHNINCPLCLGRGFIDDTAHPISTVALIYTQSKGLLINEDNLGQQLEQGEAFVTFLSGVNAIYFQRMELVNFTRTYYQHVARQAGNADKLHYKALDITSIIDKNGQSYTKTTDFVVNNGMVQWVSTHQPAKGVIYSISYHCLVTFRTILSVHRGRYISSGMKSSEIVEHECQEQWKIKEAFLVEQTKSDGKLIENNTFFQPGQ